MAARRPNSSRSKPSIFPPTQPQRPKSVIGRPLVSQRGPDELHDSRVQRHQDGEETNIKVVLRCRARSEREIQANSPGVVQIEGAKSRELTVETSSPVSTFGVVNLPPTRTYPFDLVFGPEATQSMIYHDVVSPMLDEVKMGYNCTLFAYGQTGTGKTYTMQGDLYPTALGNPSAQAGIIPRVLFRLFHDLEKTQTDFVVKISFIELYNEELRDLLAADLAPPTTLTQPMGMAAKDTKGGEEKLKIFDDVNKRGILIQGLEEIAVKDSNAALALLTKGSERRQIAATKFNDHSSRSHSVFSITVHIKESSSLGDDLLKVGKLNLVDLAGSENIGRSGAENKRAREAGMINQSLLTLGRVINALVDKAQHVPYRESKLTRILQDSLGGRTKTSIIATISPARSNLEETLSTLDYSLRAKSIKNKPELNQRMTRNSLLKEYVSEIERLKADLLATREKNGFNISEETYTHLIAENEVKETELAEARKQVEIIENQLRHIRDEYDQSIAILKRREEELCQTTAKLEETKETLGRREAELQITRKAYKEEVIVRKAHQETEMSLDGVAKNLKNVASQSLRDVAGLFDKLDRQRKVLLSNKKVVSDNEKLIHSLATSLSTKLTELAELSSKLMANLENEAQEYHHSETEAITDHIERINSHYKKSQGLFQQVESHEIEGDAVLASLKQEMAAASSYLREEVSSWSKNLTTTSNRLSEKSSIAFTEQVHILEQSAELLYSLIEALSKNIYSYVDDESAALAEIRTIAKTATDKEISILQQQNKILAEMLANERKSAEAAKNDLLQRVTGLMDEFLKARDDGLRQSVGNLQRSNDEAERLLMATYERQSAVHDNIQLRHSELDSQLNDINEQSVETRKRMSQSATKTRGIVEAAVDEIQNTMTDSVASYSAKTYQRLETMQDKFSTAFEGQSRVKRARIEATNTILANFREHSSTQQELLELAAKEIESHTQLNLSWVREHNQYTKDYETSTGCNLQSIEEARLLLATKGTEEDGCVGSTPRKRKWQYDDEWALTKSRDELLRRPTVCGDTDMIVVNEILPEEQENSEAVKSGRNKKYIAFTVSEPDREDSENVGLQVNNLVNVKAEVVETDVPAVELLVESRKRNVTNGRSTRRVRS